MEQSVLVESARLRAVVTMSDGEVVIVFRDTETPDDEEELTAMVLGEFSQFSEAVVRAYEHIKAHA
jgi:hypothetical protein